MISAGTLMVKQPNKNDSAAVNNPKKMKFVGAVRRTLSQHDIAIIVTNARTRATHNNSG